MKRFFLAGLFGVSLFVLFASAVPVRAQDKPEFELVDGDRVAFVGNTFFEREQLTSYLEAELTTRYPDRNIVFRNLGWSGDTVSGVARGYFEGAEQGFARLQKVVGEVKPTVVIVAYGMGESFEGPAGLPGFQQGLERMLDMLTSGGARAVLLSPITHESLGPPLPDPAGHNRNLRLYTDAIRRTAEKRGHPFVNLFELTGQAMRSKPPVPLTENGVHLSPYGYWRVARLVQESLGLGPRGWAAEIDAAGKSAKADGADVSDVAADGKGVRFQVKTRLLEIPPPLDGGGAGVLRVAGLAAGNYVLKSGDVIVAAGSAEEWAQGVPIVGGPAGQQANKLRDLIISKNVQFFNRYRPQNETYIFGFRQGEQGRNAIEIPMFDKPIAEKEAEIAKLRVPAAASYTLQPE